jgi:hypothetical protein
VNFCACLAFPLGTISQRFSGGQSTLFWISWTRLSSQSTTTTSTGMLPASTSGSPPHPFRSLTRKPYIPTPCGVHRYVPLHPVAFTGTYPYTLWRSPVRTPTPCGGHRYVPLHPVAINRNPPHRSIHYKPLNRNVPHRSIYHTSLYRTEASYLICPQSKAHGDPRLNVWPSSRSS